MKRRDFVSAGARTLAGIAVGNVLSRGQDLETAQILSAVGVDAHCHIFNLTDLPAYGFVTSVFADTDEWVPPLGVPVEVFIRILVRLIEGFDQKTGRDEIKELDRLMRLADPAAGAAESVRLLNEDPDAAKTLRTLADPEAARREEEQQWEERVRQEMEKIAKSADPEERQVYEWLNAEARSTAESPGLDITNREHFRSLLHGPPGVGEFAARRRTVIGRITHWLFGFRRFRYQNFEELRSTLGGNGGVHLFTPALIDYNFWIDNHEDTKTPLQDQVNVMGKLAIYLRGRMHGYMAFDPLRGVHLQDNGADPLALVRDAILNKGFLGVKLYPPMGFRAALNAEFDRYHAEAFSDVGRKVWERHKSGLGKKLDGVLDALFAFCVEQEAAIMAHTSPTNYAKKIFQDQPNPKYWAEALKRHPNLRVSFGHLAGLSADTLTGEGRAWVESIAKLATKYPHVYADVAYHDVVLNREGEAKRYFENLTSLVKAYPVMRSRLLYGTDWSMLGAVSGWENYLREFQAGIKAHRVLANNAERNAFFGNNALHFFGLMRGGKARGRLEAFYKANKMTVGAYPDWWQLTKA